MVFLVEKFVVSMSHDDSSNDQQGTSWEQLTSEMGTYRISLRPGTHSRRFTAYSDLTTSYVEIKKEFADDSDYGTNYASIEAYKDAEIYVKITLNDAHVAKSGSGSGYGGPNGTWTADTVHRTTTVNVSSLKLSNSSGSVNITNPTFAVTDSL